MGDFFSIEFQILTSFQPIGSWFLSKSTPQYNSLTMNVIDRLITLTNSSHWQRKLRKITCCTSCTITYELWGWAVKHGYCSNTGKWVCKYLCYSMSMITVSNINFMLHHTYVGTLVKSSDVYVRWRWCIRPGRHSVCIHKYTYTIPYWGGRSICNFVWITTATEEVHNISATVIPFGMYTYTT